MVGPLFSVAYLAVAASATHTWVLFAGQLLNATAIAAVQGLGGGVSMWPLPQQYGVRQTLTPGGTRRVSSTELSFA